MQLAEVLSWRIAVELWRRFPDRFMLLELHPGGGMYDCLTLWERTQNRSVLEINRQGSVHLWPTSGDHQSWQDWDLRFLAVPPLKFIDELTVALRLPIPKALPPSTAATVAYRFIAEFLTHTVGRLELWECRSGFFDTSGYGGGKRRDFFEKFPALASHPLPQRHPALQFDFAYYYWFLLRDQEPQLCLNTDGMVFTTSGAVHDLLPLYKQKRRIWPLINKAAGSLLP